MGSFPSKSHETNVRRIYSPYEISTNIILLIYDDTLLPAFQRAYLEDKGHSEDWKFLNW